MNDHALLEIKKLSELELLEQVKRLAEEERRNTVQILYCLVSIEERRLYAKRGYSSLHEFVVHELKYSDGAAYRRIQAMRLMKSVPEVKEKIETGRLSLTNAALAQKFIREHSKPRSEKHLSSEKQITSLNEKAQIELIERLENKSTREGERTLLSLSPLPKPKDKERILSAQSSEIRFVADKELLEKLQEIKNLFAHKNVNPTYNELLHEMADCTLNIMKKKTGLSDSKRSPQSRADTSSRYISVRTRREVWARDKGCCQFQDPLTGKKCGAKFGLEIDHRVPFALGGSRDAQNLRLLCKSHNLLTAAEQFKKSREKWLLRSGAEAARDRSD